MSLLVAGYDSQGPQLYQVDPSGSYFAWKASAIGKNMTNAKTFLEKRYSDEMELEAREENARAIRSRCLMTVLLKSSACRVPEEGADGVIVFCARAGCSAHGDPDAQGGA